MIRGDLYGGRQQGQVIVGVDRLLRKRRAEVRTQTVQWLRVLGRLDRFAGERAAIEKTVERIEALSAS